MNTASYSLTTAIQLGDLVMQAYNTYAQAQGSLTPVLTTPPASPPDGWSLAYYIAVTDQVLLVREKSFFGMILSNNGDWMIVLRGTDNALEWIEDVEAVQTPFAVRGVVYGSVEGGFNEVCGALTVLDREGNALGKLPQWLGTVSSQAQVTIAGHSLGGAVATLLAAQAAIQGNPTVLYTFASPLVGDAHFATAFDDRDNLSAYRIFNLHDMVTTLPFASLGFQHVEAGVQIDSTDEANICTTIPCLHSMQTYLATLGSQNFPTAESDCLVNPAPLAG